MDLISAIVQTVIFLFATPQIDLAPMPIGTAFLVQYPSPSDPKKFIPLVITAKHVLGDFSKVYGRFNTQVGTQTALVEYDIAALKNSNDYWEHEDPGVDIAVFRTLHFKEVKYEAIPQDLIAKREDFLTEDIKQTDRVIFPGLLTNFMGQSKNFPVMKDGSIALIPNEAVPIKYKVGSKEICTNQELIFLNGISIPGLSGCPVFLWPGPRLKGNAFNIGGQKPFLLGVMHGFYPALPREVIKAETTESKFFYQDNSGVAIIFPSWRLREILEMASLLAPI
jgi:hypothetical protein